MGSVDAAKALAVGQRAAALGRRSQGKAGALAAEFLLVSMLAFVKISDR